MDVDIMQAFRMARHNGRSGWVKPDHRIIAATATYGSADSPGARAASNARVARAAEAAIAALAALAVSDDSWTWDENEMITF